MNKNIAIVLGGAVAGFLLGLAFSPSPDSLGVKILTDRQTFLNGFDVDSGAAAVVLPSISGDLTLGGDLTITTSNTATSTLEVGCIQTYATSTATAVRLSATTTPGIAYWSYGSCPI